MDQMVHQWVAQYSKLETYQKKYSWQESHTTYSSEQTRETVEASQIPDGVRNDLENQVNSEIASENEQAKQEAEKKAEETQKEMQKEEDKKAEQIEEEIKKDDQQFQDQVDKANETIDRNKYIDLIKGIMIYL